MASFDLPLDTDDNHPRRLLKVGSDVLVWGGDDGVIAKLVGKESAQVVHTLEDSVRALAISDDGKRVVVGYDIGTTTVFFFDDFQAGEEHPFCAGQTGKTSAGPSFDSPLRDLQFYPKSHRIAMASESGFFISNVESDSAIAKEPRYLKEEAEKEHDESGIRSLAFGQQGDKVLLASLAMDGRLCLWNVSDHDPSKWSLLKREASCCITRKDVGEILGSDAADRSCRPHWVQDGLLALPGETYLQLRSIDSSTWQVSDFDQPVFDGDLPIQGHVESIVAMVSHENCLVTSGRDGRVVAWELYREKAGAMRSKFLYQIGQYDSPPTDLLWDRSGDEEVLYIPCENGTMSVVTGRANIAPGLSSDASSSKSAATGRLVPKATIEEFDDEDDELFASAGDGKTDAAPASEAPCATAAVRDALSSDEEDENEPPAEPAEKPTSPEAQRLTKPNHDDAMSDDDDLFNTDKASPPKSRFVDDEAADDDDDDDDDSLAPTGRADGVTGQPKESSPMKATGGDDNDSIDDNSHMPPANDDDDFDQLPAATRHYPILKLPEPQAAFAASSTPLDLSRRFMCWNHIGSVTHMQGDPGITRSSIDIDFTDSAFRRPITFTDNMGFILGSLGEDGGIFATDIADDDDLDDDEDLGDVVEGLHMSEATKAAVKRSHRARMSKGGSNPKGSSIYFHRFETFGALREKDWYLTLPDGERALGCACGEGWAAVMTSRRFLRLFSSGGNQGQILWLGGEPLTMVGRSRLLAVFYHEAAPLHDGTQKLGYMLVDALANRVVSRGSSTCISTGSSLSWAGFSNDGSLMAMDSDGMLSMLVSSDIPPEDGQSTSWEWVPMLDTVGLRKSSDDSFWPVTVYDGKLVCVPLKGGTKYPDATRRPVTTSLGLRLPLARGNLAKCNALEELSVRADIALIQKKVIHSISTGGTDEEFENEYHVLSAQVDKVTLKMFAAIVEAGKLERALDLVERLHLEKSFDLAMTIADSHRKLVDLIEDARDRKFGADQEEEIEDFESPEYSDPMEHRRITPDASSLRKRSGGASFDDRRVRPKEGMA